jgi:hypothetical protein
LDTAYISAFSALAGAAIGGMTSFATSWSTLRAQLRSARREAERNKMEALYSDFISEASRLFGDALSHQKEEIADLVRLSAMIGHMRLISDRAVIDAAERVSDTIIETYLGPNRNLRELRTFLRDGGINVMIEFGEACRQELTMRAIQGR